MGRYSTDLAGPAPASQHGSCGIPSNQYNISQVPQSPVFDNQQTFSNNWPTQFNKPIVALDLNGIIIEDVIIKGPESIKVLPGVLDAIRTIRLKGHKLMILSDQPSISRGLNSTQHIDSAFQELMNIFGKAGIMSIDGFLYNTSEMKEDEYAKPNLGMVKRAETEILRNTKFKEGWYVGDSLIDLKFADKIGSIPVLIKTGNSQQALEQLEKFTYKDLKAKTKVYDSLLDFANSL